MLVFIRKLSMSFSQMSTHLPRFQSFFLDFLHDFVLAKLATSSIRVKQRINCNVILDPIDMKKKLRRLTQASLLDIVKQVAQRPDSVGLDFIAVFRSLRCHGEQLQQQHVREAF